MPQTGSKNDIVVIGELNVDLVAAGLSVAPELGREVIADDFELTLGSVSAIFACGAARLGRGVTFISRVGRDHFGEFCINALAARGVSTDLVAVADGSKTGVTMVLSTPHDRALVTYLGAISELGFDDIPLEALDGHRHMHLTSYFLQSGLRSDVRRLIQAATERGMTVSFDPNSDPSSEWDPEIFGVIELADILFVNESEAAQMASEPNIFNALAKLAEHCKCVVIKRGPAGAVATRDGELVDLDGFRVTTVDTVGAGDSFDAGFVHAFLDGSSLAECLTIGNACGAISVTKAGGTTAQPDSDEVCKLITEQTPGPRAPVTVI